MPMADRTSASITINAPRSKVMAVIADFPAYPEWAEGITAAEIVSEGADGRAERTRLTLEAGPIKDTLLLAYEWDGDDSVRWNLVEPGAMLTAMNGTYRLVEDGEGTDVTYELAVNMRMPMIGMVKRKAEKWIIETALKELKRSVEA